MFHNMNWICFYWASLVWNVLNNLLCIHHFCYWLKSARLTLKTITTLFPILNVGVFVLTISTLLNTEHFSSFVSALLTTWNHLSRGCAPAYLCYNIKTYQVSTKQVFTVNTERGLNPITFRQNGDRRLTFIGCKRAFFFFLLLSTKWPCCLLSGTEIGYWIKACAYISFIHVYYVVVCI